MPKPVSEMIQIEIKGLTKQLNLIESGNEDHACQCKEAKETEDHVCDDCEFFDCGSSCNCACSKTYTSEDPSKHQPGCEFPTTLLWLNDRIKRLTDIAKAVA